MKILNSSYPHSNAIFFNVHIESMVQVFCTKHKITMLTNHTSEVAQPITSDVAQPVTSDVAQPITSDIAHDVRFPKYIAEYTDALDVQSDVGLYMYL